MATFHTPTFNLQCSAWYPPHAPPLTPDLVAISCCLRSPGRQSVGYYPHPGVVNPQWILCVPRGTDLRDQYCAPGLYYVEVPSGSGRIYSVVIVDDVARGFANEYRIAYIEKVGTWPTPIP